jgi:signal transduction histidine kinase
VQSLAAIEMRLDVAARRADAPTLAHELRTLRDLVHDESLNLRDVMQRLRYCDVTPDRLRLELGDLVGRFAAISRIHAQVDWRVARLEVPPAVCRELLRIVQEALVNVRRHSGATRVNVALAQHRRSLTLTIADNGVGLGFKGRVSPREAAAPSLPRVIRERVDMLGGRLEIESGPAGTTLWIAIPTCLEE